VGVALPPTVKLQEDISALEAATPTPVTITSGHLEEKIQEIAGYDRKTAEKCVHALLESYVEEETDVEILESLFYLGLGQPKLAERFEVSIPEIGRDLAAGLERDGEIGKAIAVLQKLSDSYPENRALEREVAAVMRRHGLTSELVDRYLDRAKDLLEKGRTMEAIPWLQEILLIDRSRRDVARLIRDLRYQDVESAARSKRRWRLSALALLVSAAASVLILRELKIYQAYGELPARSNGVLGPMRERLYELEDFAEENPIWHRSFFIRTEMADLRAEVGRLELAAAEQETQATQLARQRLMQAQTARERGLAYAEAGDFETALARFKDALAWSDPDWTEREQIANDIAAITEWLEGQKQ